jgi:hypothetical protein
MSNKTASQAQAEPLIENRPAATKNSSGNNDSAAVNNSTANSIYLIDRILIALVIISFLLTVIAQINIALNR